MKLTVIGRAYGISNEEIEKVAEAAFSYLKIKENDGEIELKLVSQRVMQQLNRSYRGVDRPTDVLSFRLTDEPLVGQIFICYTYTVASARGQKRDLASELALLIVHGILHLCGYDHSKVSDERKMQNMESRILIQRGYIR